MTTTTTEQDGPPRPVLPMKETTGQPKRDAGVRPYCAAQVYDAEGQPMDCTWRGAMTWHGIPFCAAHAPKRTPGIGGWCLL